MAKHTDAQQKAIHAKVGKSQPHDSYNHLTGSEKDKLRKKFGNNHLTGSQMDYGRKEKAKNF